MHVVYTGEQPPDGFSKSLFLAGPTPRDAKTKSWRPQALRLLKRKGYDGVVFCPENRPGTKTPDYDDMVDWEHRMLNMSDCVLFWVPRELKKMPAFTTNVEFGSWVKSGKIVFGAPPNAPKMGYIGRFAYQELVPLSWRLDKTIGHALEKIGEGSYRTSGERNIPLFIWRCRSFQNWYQAQREVGNELRWARLAYSCRPREKFVYSWVLEAHVFVVSENRVKSNEIVISRGDISSVVLYRRAINLLDSEIVLVREFRSPGNNPSGFVWEIPGGSSHKPDMDPKQVAAEEVFEETGLKIKPKRIRSVGVRQLMATFSTHRAHVFSAELSEKDIAWFRAQKGIARGVDLDTNETGERVYTEVVTLREVLEKNLVDWSNVGMIMAALQEAR